MAFDPVTDYPLGTRRPDLVTTPSGLPLDDVTLAGARAGALASGDTRATAATLALQAEVARAAGRVQLAEGIERAAELTRVPDDELLAIYTALRPGRSSADELEAWAARLDELGARATTRRSSARRRRRTARGGSPRMADARRSGRFTAREESELRREVLVEPWPELGLVAADGPADPEPELVVENGSVVRLDGRDAADFDVIDRFLVAHGIDLDVAEEAMALPDERLARMLVDVDVPRDALVRLARGLTPAKLARVVGMLDPVELMMALKKLRARRDPGNQAHVTNLKESPALLAADAAEAARRGFDELETTVGVARYAPLNALALLVGSQTGRPGVMTQCAVEERRNLELAIRGLVTYAETLSVYGTEPVFADGDDTPWSKAFLASAYASRGVKVRFTSGTGSEALMGHAQGLSMLYLEARCVSVVRAAGAQGVQNGSISCVALVLAVPGGTRAILAENVLAAWLDLEVASGNDAIASHSPIRKTAKLMGQFLPGTDFVTSGYSIMGRRDNTFGGGNYDADDIDEWLTMQRDWQVDGGIEPIEEAEALRVRERAARAVQAVFAELGLPAVTDAEVEAATLAHGSADMPDRDRAADVEAADELLARGVSALDVALALDRQGFEDVAEAVVGMLRQRIAADYLQTSAVIEPDGLVRSAVNDPNLYLGPGTGYRLEGERWALLQSLPHVVDPRRLGAAVADAEAIVEESGPAVPGSRPGRGRDRRRPRFRGRPARDDRRTAARRGAGRGRRRRARGGWRRRGSSGSCGRRTSPSSATTARCSPGPVSRSASSRRGPR